MYSNKRTIARITVPKSLRSALFCAALSVFGSGAQADTTLVFADNLSPSNPFPGAKPTQQTAMAPGVEFRVVTSTGFVSGGGEKSIIGQSVVSNPPSFVDGGPLLPTPAGWQFVSWVFDSNNQLAAVLNSDTTLGATASVATCNGITSAAPLGATGLFRNALFLAAPFGFLAPTVGSAAAAAYGVGQLSFSGVSAFTVRIPVAEAQWSNCPFQLGGQNNAGISFLGTVGADRHTFRLVADHEIGPTGVEDSLGFAGQNTQWDLVGVINSDPSPNITSYSTLPAQQLVIPLTSLATDRESDGLSISTTGSRAVTGSAGGSVTCTATDCTYNPAGSAGTDSFTITVVDDCATTVATCVQGSGNITVTVNVTAAPIASNDAFTVSQNSANNSLNLTANDLPGSVAINPAAITIVSPPGNGTIGTPLPGDGTVSYTPNAGFSGTDSFSYTVDDTLGNVSNTASVTVTVNCIDACASSGTAPSGGMVTGSVRITAADLVAAGVPADDGADGVGVSCDPDCFDFVVAAPGGQVQVVFALSGPIKPQSVYRKVVNGTWRSFDSTGGNAVKSALGAPGSCPPPGDPAYSTGLAAGDLCLELTIVDGGPNDADSIVGQVSDPGGIGSGLPAPVVLAGQELSSTPGGCTLSPTGSWRRGDLWLIGLVLIVLGYRLHSRRGHAN